MALLLRVTPSLLSPGPSGSVSAVTSFHFPSHPLIAATSFPTSFAFSTFPALCSFLFLASVHTLYLSPASSSDLHLRLQHIFTHLQFASSVSPAEFSQLPFPHSVPTYHRAHNNTVLLLCMCVCLCVCVIWKHKHIHVPASASGSYQSLALIGQ